MMASVSDLARRKLAGISVLNRRWLDPLLTKHVLYAMCSLEEEEEERHVPPDKKMAY